MNTEYIYGVVLYTGVESKIFLNLNEPKHKVTHVEQLTNQQMYKIFGVLFVLCFMVALILGVETDKRIHRCVVMVHACVLTDLAIAGICFVFCLFCVMHDYLFVWCK